MTSDTPRLSRRAFLLLAGGVALEQGCTWARTGSAGEVRGSDPLSGLSLFADVETYAAFGAHRTGTVPDLQTFDWVSDALSSAGLAPRCYSYPARNFFLEDCRLEVAGEAIESFPLWLPTATGRPVTAELCPAEERTRWQGRIPVFVLEGLAGYLAMRDIPAQLEAAEAKGAILITRTPPGSYFAANSQTTCERPVVTVGSRYEEKLLQAVAQGAPASLAISGTMRNEAKSQVVVAETGPQSAPAIVISTPLSAFTLAAGERGCGIALFLGLARHYARRDARFLFLAETGHEIDSPGLRQYMKTRRPEIADVRAWVHLGANIATYKFVERGGELVRTGEQQTATRLITNNPSIEGLLTEVFAGTVYQPRMTERSFGTTGLYMKYGYPVFGFEGGSAHHHTPDDRPFVTGPALLESVAQKIRRTIELVLDTRWDAAAD